MKGIILKELYETFCIKKNLFALLFLFMLIILFVSFFENLYTFILVVGITLPLICSTPMQFSMEQDAICEFNTILLTYPLSKKKIILAKYLYCFLFIIGCWLLSFFITLVYVYIHRTIALYLALEIFIAGMILSLIVFSICNIGSTILGSKKGVNLFIAISFVFILGYTLSVFNIDVENILLFDKHLLMLIGTATAFVLLFVSYYISLWVYTKRYS